MQIGVVYPQTELGRSIEDFGAEFAALSCGAESLAADSNSWQSAGGTHFALATMGFGLNSVESHIDYIASAASALGLA